MDRIGEYRKYFTKDYLMGPNSFRLLNELLECKPENTKEADSREKFQNTDNISVSRILDLGCGLALTSMFLADETDAKSVYAFDLWIAASENYERIKKNDYEQKIIPIHGDAMEMPFAHEYFDAIVSVDAYHYFGCKEGVFADKILPFIKKDGYVMIAVPGLKEEPKGELNDLFHEWAEGDDADLFQTKEWWERLLRTECGDTCDVTVKEAECYDIAWREWFDTGHEYGLRDQEYLEKGLYDILNFVLIYVKKNA